MPREEYSYLTLTPGPGLENGGFMYEGIFPGSDPNILDTVFRQYISKDDYGINYDEYTAGVFHGKQYPNGRYETPRFTELRNRFRRHHKKNPKNLKKLGYYPSVFRKTSNPEDINNKNK